MTRITCSSVALFCALVCLAIAGCGSGGEKKVVVTGKVLQNGQPVQIADFYEGLNCLVVEFIKLDEQGNLVTTELAGQDVNEDGTFEITGPDGEGMPVGKYRVAVYHRAEGTDPDDEGTDDLFQGKYSPENSKFEYDVTGQEIVIELSEAG